MIDHKREAKRILVHYVGLLAQKVRMNWDQDNEVELEAFVEHILAAGREPNGKDQDNRPYATDHEGLAGVFKFTYEQLYDLLHETIGLGHEYIERHGFSRSQAEEQAVCDTLEGLREERGLWAMGEIKNPSQILP